RFNEVMWDEGRCALHPELIDGAPVSATTPEQLLGLSLSPALIQGERAVALISTLERELFTPLGLRRAPGETTVQTSWLGSFHAAYLRAHERNARARANVVAWLESARRHLEEHALGILPESLKAPPKISRRKPVA